MRSSAFMPWKACHNSVEANQEVSNRLCMSIDVRSPQIPAAARMLRINSPARV
jgi:hypothetical protein